MARPFESPQPPLPSRRSSAARPYGTIISSLSLTRRSHRNVTCQCIPSDFCLCTKCHLLAIRATATKQATEHGISYTMSQPLFVWLAARPRSVVGGIRPCATFGGAIRMFGGSRCSSAPSIRRRPPNHLMGHEHLPFPVLPCVFRSSSRIRFPQRPDCTEKPRPPTRTT